MRAKLTAPPRRPAAPEPTSQTKPAEPWSVSEYAGHVKTALRRHLPEAISVRGEVADWNVNRRSGHHYFSLKDQNAKLDGIVYGSRARGLDFVPTTGDEVVVDGSASFYAPFGKLSLIVESVRPAGAGALEAAFQRLKAKLLAEGLFNDERKRPVPSYPTRIAIVTSAGAAGYQDVRKVFRAYPHLTLMLYNVAVQGDAAAREVAAAMSHLGQRHGDVGGVDVVLLVRGGGSREDLWAFNEEAVARAVADCPLPVVTGLGHETDTHLADLAADLHAHTPTQAAQLVAASWRNAADRVDQLAIVLRRGMRDAYRDARDDLRQISRHEVFRRPLDLVERRRARSGLRRA